MYRILFAWLCGPLRIGRTLYSKIVGQTNVTSPKLRDVFTLYLYVEPKGLDCGFAEAASGQACERTRRELGLMFWLFPDNVKSLGEFAVTRVSFPNILGKRDRVGGS